MHDQALLKLDVSRRKTLEFYNEYFIYNGNRVYYADINGISYLWTRTRHSVYFIPVGTSNSYVIQIRHQSKTETIELSGIASAERQGNFGILVNIIDKVMKPNVIVNLLKQIKSNGSIKIGNLEITKEGITKSTFFSKDSIEWPEYFNTVVDSGNVFIYKDVNGKAKLFNQQSMGNLNAVILPDLLAILMHNKGNIDLILEQESEESVNTIEEGVEFEKSDKKKNMATFCNQCGHRVDLDGRYCGDCGNEIRR